jgi:hypothetical protein
VLNTIWTEQNSFSFPLPENASAKQCKQYIFNSSYDATEEPTAGLVLGRLVNHGYKQEINAKMKIVITDNNKPILCLFSTRAINAGEEVLYDYGQKNYPWENKVCQ